MNYKVGDIITVKLSVVNIDECGWIECCHIGCEKDYLNDDTDTICFDEEYIKECTE